jgi:hypothetical protein
MAKKTAPAGDRDALLRSLEARFEAHMERHKGMKWADVRARLEARPEKLKALLEMERSGGEPDVVGQDKKTGELRFVDCSPETPRDVEASATTARRSTAARSTSPRETSWTRPRRWASSS